jgi:hypothetical protein
MLVSKDHIVPSRILTLVQKLKIVKVHIKCLPSLSLALFIFSFKQLFFIYQLYFCILGMLLVGRHDRKSSEQR